MKKLISSLLVLASFLFLLPAAQAARRYVAVVGKSELAMYWQIIHYGCSEAAAANNADLRFTGPAYETEMLLQPAILEDTLAARPDVICLAAQDADAVMPQLEACVEKGIPVIALETALPGAPQGAVLATVTTDNAAAGALAADELHKLPAFRSLLTAASPAQPVVIAVLSQDDATEAIVLRTSGFIDRMKAIACEYGLVSITGAAQWADEVADAGIILHVETAAAPDAQAIGEAAASMLALDGLSAAFCTSEQAANGLLSVTANGADFGSGGAYEGILVAGFDAGARQKQAVRAGWFVGSVTQDLYRLGYAAVETAIRCANGEPAADVAVEALWYTSRNMDTLEFIFNVYD